MYIFQWSDATTDAIWPPKQLDNNTSVVATEPNLNALIHVFVMACKK